MGCMAQYFAMVGANTFIKSIDLMGPMYLIWEWFYLKIKITMKNVFFLIKVKNKVKIKNNPINIY